MIEEIKEIVGDEEFQTSIKNTVSNLELLTGDLRDFVAVASEGEGTIGLFMSDDKLYRHMDELILDIKKHPWKLLYRPKESRRKEK